MDLFKQRSIIPYNPYVCKHLIARNYCKTQNLTAALAKYWAFKCPLCPKVVKHFYNHPVWPKKTTSALIDQIGGKKLSLRL